jgi:diguanylate cyclase (GGDEF)-like protein/PAS domain S-box-containing protein
MRKGNTFSYDFLKYFSFLILLIMSVTIISVIVIEYAFYNNELRLIDSTYKAIEYYIEKSTVNESVLQDTLSFLHGRKQTADMKFKKELIVCACFMAGLFITTVLLFRSFSKKIRNESIRLKTKIEQSSYSMSQMSVEDLCFKDHREIAEKTNSMISAHIKALTQLRESEERFELVFNAANDGIWDLDLKNNRAFFSKTYRQMLGYEDNETIPNEFDWKERIHPLDLPDVLQALNDHYTGKTTCYISEHRVKSKDGTYVWVLDRGKAVFDGKGTPIRIVGSHTDISDWKIREEELRKCATTDSLTNAYNRLYGLNFLARQMQMSINNGEKLTICYIDVNDLKKINDTYGHGEGDELIINIINILRSSIRSSDIISRLGGDEFIVIFPKTDLITAYEIRKRIHVNLQKYNFISQKNYKISFSMGFIEYDHQKHISPENLISEADKEMYKDKFTYKTIL